MISSRCEIIERGVTNRSDSRFWEEKIVNLRQHDPKGVLTIASDTPFGGKKINSGQLTHPLRSLNSPESTSQRPPHVLTMMNCFTKDILPQKIALVQRLDKKKMVKPVLVSLPEEILTFFPANAGAEYRYRGWLASSLKQPIANQRYDSTEPCPYRIRCVCSGSHLGKRKRGA